MSHKSRKRDVKGTGELVIYLDLDGVVHHQAVYQDRRRGIYMSPTEAPGRKLFEWAHLLVELLRPYPSVRLVLSSSWCRRPGYSRTLQRLPLELRTRFVGGTFHRREYGADQGAELAFASLPRGVQISTDVARRQPRDWLALDDDDRGWPAEHRDRLLLCNGELGLSDPATQRELTSRLSNMVYPAMKRKLGPLDAPLPDDVLSDFEVGSAQNLHALALDVFSTAAEADAWLHRPHPLLQDQTPLAHAETAGGEQRVIDVLVAIRYGGAA